MCKCEVAVVTLPCSRCVILCHFSHRDFIRAGVVRSLVDCLSTISSTDDVMAGTYGFLSKTYAFYEIGTVYYVRHVRTRLLVAHSINYGFGLHALQALFFFAEVFDRPLAPTETPLTPADKLDILRVRVLGCAGFFLAMPFLGCFVRFTVGCTFLQAFGIHAVDQLDSFLNTIVRATVLWRCVCCETSRGIAVA